MKKKKKKLRPVGDTLLDLEVLLFELTHDHGLQKGDVLSLVSSWIDVHYPAATEEYLDGRVPVLFYGHPEGLIKLGEKLKK